MDGWLDNFNLKEYQYFFTSLLTGWTNNDIGYKWLIRVFNEETKAKVQL